MENNLENIENFCLKKDLPTNITGYIFVDKSIFIYDVIPLLITLVINFLKRKTSSTRKCVASKGSNRKNMNEMVSKNVLLTLGKL